MWLENQKHSSLVDGFTFKKVFPTIVKVWHQFSGLLLNKKPLFKGVIGVKLMKEFYDLDRLIILFVLQIEK